jgi:hypothetical protein
MLTLARRSLAGDDSERRLRASDLTWRGIASRGLPEDLPTSQMSDPKGSELAGYQRRNSQLDAHRRVTEDDAQTPLEWAPSRLALFAFKVTPSPTS